MLIITYYWPPSGGAGVQRWLKLSKYLSQIGVEVHVLTVDEKYASYPHLDESLNNDIRKEVEVIKTKAINYFSLYERLVGKDKVPKAGFSNVDVKKKSNKLLSSIRSHLFIPDPRKGWNRYAYSAAVEVIESKNITNVITTSPPHSTQLIGLKLKKKFPHINWIADLRDPWTDIYYYQLLGHSKFSHEIDKGYERDVLRGADLITTVSDGLREMFLSKGAGFDLNEEKIKVISNGFDAEDFKELNGVDDDIFSIVYTGTMSEQYEPHVFLNAYAKLCKEVSGKVELKFVGKLSNAISTYMKEAGITYEFFPQVPHDEIVNYQLNATILLLVIPNVANSKGIITGKLFEYLASQNQLLVIGPKDGDAAAFVEKAGAGHTFSRDEGEEIYQYLKKQHEAYMLHGKQKVPKDNIQQFERSVQAVQFKKLLK
ncbi:hypothetical protein CRYO30217_02497 [Parvicella tangerina]|uniref:Glycosyltransferase subfamily 4-like N-terminal domain-containing protein n=1 Tax=Parvicella tangerina TaxID=2829795 RepID=A0A916NI80_9FLAO|nr:hypothetical protein CRYO30217_02497 [Parvicella tangerina]